MFMTQIEMPLIYSVFDREFGAAGQLIDQERRKSIPLYPIGRVCQLSVGNRILWM